MAYVSAAAALTGTTPSVSFLGGSGDVYTITLTGNTTFTFSTPPPTGYSSSVFIVITQSASVQYTTTIPVTSWVHGQSPATLALNEQAIYKITYVGGNYIGEAVEHYVHPNDGGGSITAMTGAAVLSEITVNTLGHVTGTAQRDLTLGDLGYTGATNATANTGTVTSVSGGNGLTGSVTTSGSISMGTPGTLSGSTSNGTTASSHTHSLSLATTSLGGIVGTGTQSFAGEKRFNSNVVVNSTSAAAYTLDVAGDIRATGDVISNSDATLKENVIRIDNALSKVEALEGVYFNFIGEEKKCMGVIAQQIEPTIPEVVHQSTDGIKTVSYDKIVGLLIEAIKELKQEIRDMKDGI